MASYWLSWNHSPRRCQHPALPTSLPPGRAAQAGKQATGVQALPWPLTHSVVSGSSQAVQLPTWKAESESQGCIHPAVCGLRAREWWLPDAHKNARAGRRAPVAPLRPCPPPSLPVATPTPRRAAVALCLRFRDPGSGSSLTPRHSGDAVSGLRLPWEPRGGPGARRTTRSSGRWACPALQRVVLGVSGIHLSPAARGAASQDLLCFSFN